MNNPLRPRWLQRRQVRSVPGERASELRLLIYGVRTRSVTCTRSPSLRAPWRYRCWCFLIERSTPRAIKHLQPVPSRRAPAPMPSSKRCQTSVAFFLTSVETVSHVTNNRRTSQRRDVNDRPRMLHEQIAYRFLAFPAPFTTDSEKWRRVSFVIVFIVAWI